MGRNLRFPRPNSMEDPVRVFGSMERTDHAELKRIAKIEERPLYEMIRVALKEWLRKWKVEHESTGDEIAPEERYG